MLARMAAVAEPTGAGTVAGTLEVPAGGVFASFGALFLPVGSPTLWEIL